MIYLFTAMYCEAHPFIQHYQLKKEISKTHFQVFYCEDAGIRLIITGVGMISAATAIGSICTVYGVTENDFLINVGIAAGKGALNQIFLCNQLIEENTGKTFYPDILYRHTFLETGIITVTKPLEGKKAEILEKGFLCDMEAAAIYQSGSYFFGPHQMVFLKVISDSGNSKEVTKDLAENLIAENIQEMADFFNCLLIAFQKEEKNRKDLALAAENAKKLSTAFQCSKTMAFSLEQYIRYFVLSGTDYESVIREMYREKKLPCKNKKEGKICFEEFKRKLL